MKMIRGILGISLLSLGGCESIVRMDSEAQAKLSANDHEQCSRFGYAEGSDRFADCMMDLSHRREVQRAQADYDRRMAAERERDRQAWAAAQADKKGSSSYDASPSAQDIRRGEDFENQAAQAASATSQMNCTTTTSTSGSDNNQETHTETHCH